MADKKTSDETAASTLTGAELVRGVQSAASVKITIDQIKTYISGNLGAATAKSLALAGAISAASWGLTGVGHTETARTITDTSGAGTVATGATHGLGGNTIAATNARTLTDYYSLYVKDSIAGTNVTLTTKWSLGLEGSASVGGSVRVASAGYVGWSTDLRLWRDAANALALQNGTSAQTFNLYGTWSSAGANYARLASYWSGTTATIETQVSGTGSATSLSIRCPHELYLGSNSINFMSGGGSVLWYINSPGGHILAGTDNSWDIGASGAHRPRSVYVASNVTVGNNLFVGAQLINNSNGTALVFPSDGVITVRDNAGTSFGRLQFGGTTSGFPALKRNSGNLEVRAADDSGFASLQCAGIIANGDLVVGIANKMRFGGGGGRVDLTSPADKVLKVADNAGGASIVQLQHFTVAGLPSAATYTGSVALVSDANATTARSTVAGGGSNKVMVMSDGTNWLIVA